jgi:hypothetical protein
MTSFADDTSHARVLFVAAAGPRRGYGPLVRCISFAHALGVRPLMAVQGGRSVLETALVLGADVVPDATPRAIDALQPDVVIVDEPVEAKARPWIAAARRAGALVVTFRALRLVDETADSAADARMTRTPRGRGVRIELDADLRLKLAAAVADAIMTAEPDADVRITSAVVSPRPTEPDVFGLAAPVRIIEAAAAASAKASAPNFLS